MKKILSSFLLISLITIFVPNISQALEKLQDAENNFIPTSGGSSSDINVKTNNSGSNSLDNQLSNWNSGCLLLNNNMQFYSSKHASTDETSDDEVSKLQSYLNALGFLDSDATGYFGIMTKRAVTQFQNSNHITPASGSVGPLTRSKIASFTGCDSLDQTIQKESFSIKVNPSVLNFENSISKSINIKVLHNQGYKGTVVLSSDPINISGVNVVLNKGLAPDTYTANVSVDASVGSLDEEISFTAKDLSSGFARKITVSLFKQGKNTLPLSVISPDGGETLAIGSVFNIRWNGKKGITYKVLLEDQNGNVKGIIGNFKASSYRWKVGMVGDKQIEAGDYRIRIVNNTTGVSDSDQPSGIFTTFVPVVVPDPVSTLILAPNPLNIEAGKTENVNISLTPLKDGITYKVSSDDCILSGCEHLLTKPTISGNQMTVSLKPNLPAETDAVEIHVQAYLAGVFKADNYLTLNIISGDTDTDPGCINGNIYSPITGKKCPSSPALPTINVQASPSTITAGQNSNISWSTTNANTCTYDWALAKFTAGNFLVSPSTTKTYNITCTGDGGTTSKQVTVTVNKVPTNILTINSFTASPSTVTSGGSSTLSWSATNAAYCTLNGSQVTPSSSAGTGALTSSTTYTLICHNTSGGGDTKSLTVGVSPISSLSLPSLQANALNAFSDDTNKNDDEKNKIKESDLIENSSACKVGKILMKGINDEKVKCLQQSLVKNGFKIKGIELGQETSLFGYNTMAALKEFQSSRNLKADGILGLKTREALGL